MSTLSSISLFLNTILKKIEEDLPEKADSYPSLTGKFAGLKKCRVGDYRIIYSIIGDTVFCRESWCSCR
jgi:addiction module RelE/StbE family toxin